MSFIYLLLRSSTHPFCPLLFTAGAGNLEVHFTYSPPLWLGPAKGRHGWEMRQWEKEKSFLLFSWTSEAALAQAGSRHSGSGVQGGSSTSPAAQPWAQSRGD